MVLAIACILVQSSSLAACLCFWVIGSVSVAAFADILHVKKGAYAKLEG